MTYGDFRAAIGFKESSNRYTVVNPLGYLGRYQFGTARLSDFGLCFRKSGTTGFSNVDFEFVRPFSQSGFLLSPPLQDACFDLHVWRFQEFIAHHYEGRLGDLVNGVNLTMSGAVACCHLLGQGGLDAFMKGVIQKDANGVTSTDYISQFGGYDMLTMPANSNLADLRAMSGAASGIQGLTGIGAGVTGIPMYPTGVHGATGIQSQYVPAPGIWARFMTWLSGK